MEKVIKTISSNEKDPRQSALKDVLVKVMEDHCVICVGDGHVAKDCTTKIEADKHFKLLRYGLEWGAVKSAVMTNNMNVLQHTLRKRTRSELYKAEEENVASKKPLGLRQTGTRAEADTKARADNRNVR